MNTNRSSGPEGSTMKSFHPHIHSHIPHSHPSHYSHSHIPKKICFFFWALRVSKIRNNMLTVKILRLTTNLQLLSNGTLKIWIPTYRVARILLWHLWTCTNTLYVINDLNLVWNKSWKLHTVQIEAKWPIVDKLLPFQWPYRQNVYPH